MLEFYTNLKVPVEFFWSIPHFSFDIDLGLNPTTVRCFYIELISLEFGLGRSSVSSRKLILVYISSFC